MIKKVLGVCVLAAGLTQAASYTFETAPGSTYGRAEFNVTTDQITVVLTNLVVNPTSVGSVLTSVQFALEPDTYSGGSLTSSSAKQRSVASDRSYTDSALLSTDWVASRMLNTILLSWNDGSGPDQGIIGPAGGATYSNANGSIRGNGSHNPFLAETATFVYSLVGVDEFTGIADVKLGWNTSPDPTGTQVTAACVTRGGCDTDPAPVPEPSTAGLLMGGIGLFAWYRRR
jgi:hypothetical protein